MYLQELSLPQLPQKTIHITQKVKHELSLQCKDNFLQFLMVQKAGKQGDVMFLEKLKSNYSKQFKVRIPVSKKNISYLNLNDESEKIIKKQTNFILSGRQPRVTTPLDQVVRRGQSSMHVGKKARVDNFQI
ncbi:hypothetical protein pb186bvf_004597 [Paramecium bursaria]